MGEQEIIQPEIAKFELKRIPVVGSIVDLTFEDDAYSSYYMIVEDNSQEEIRKYNSNINLDKLIQEKTNSIIYILKDSPLATALLKSGKEGDTITFDSHAQKNTITIHKVYFPKSK